MTNLWISTFGTHFNDKITYDFYLQTMFSSITMTFDPPARQLAMFNRPILTFSSFEIKRDPIWMHGRVARDAQL